MDTWCCPLRITDFWCGHFALFANDSVTIRVQHYPENAFLRIQEFFSGNEYSGDKLIIRTNSDREGLYFSIPLGKKIPLFEMQNLLNSNS